MERGSLQAAREASSNNQPQHKAPKRDQLPRCKLKERIRIAGAETSALQATPKTATHKQSLQTNRSNARRQGHKRLPKLSGSKAHRSQNL